MALERGWNGERTPDSDSWIFFVTCQPAHWDLPTNQPFWKRKQKGNDSDVSCDFRFFHSLAFFTLGLTKTAARFFTPILLFINLRLTLKTFGER